MTSSPESIAIDLCLLDNSVSTILRPRDRIVENQMAEIHNTVENSLGDLENTTLWLDLKKKFWFLETLASALERSYNLPYRFGSFEYSYILNILEEEEVPRLQII